MVIFVTKTSCPRREMTSLALTVCAHIAATLYTPRFCAFEHRFLPFPNLTPNPPSALPYASRWWRGWEGGWGWLRRVCPLPRGWWRGWKGGGGWLRRVCPLILLAAEGMGRGKGMAPAVMSFVSLLVGVLGRGMGVAPGVMP